MSDPVTMETPESEAHTKFFTPLVQPAVEEVPAGLKTYISSFLPLEDFNAYFEQRGVSLASPRFGNPPLDLIYRRPSGQLSSIAPLINSAIERMAATLEALIKLTEAIQRGDMESVESMVHFASVGSGSVLAQLLHTRPALFVR